MYRAGMQIKLKEDISESLKAFGNTRAKQKMAGTIQTIEKIGTYEGKTRIFLRPPYSTPPGEQTSFVPEDIEIIITKPKNKIKAKIFDPTLLDL